MRRSWPFGERTNPHPVHDPERIPAQRYYDPEFYQMELDHLWPHVWQMACRIEQIPDEGDWIEYQNVGKSVVIVNTGAQGIKAYHNACRHRGVPIAGNPRLGDLSTADHGNCKKSGFVCPFHGWRFDMHGENASVYGRHLFDARQLEDADLNLIPCRAETAIGAVWINFDDDAPSVRESMGEIIDRLEAHHVDKLRTEWCYGTVLPANWKLAMEAFMEGYHVMTTHPQLQAAHPMMFDGTYVNVPATVQLADPALSHRENQELQIRSMALLSEGMAGMVHQKEVEIARTMVGVEEGLPEDRNEAVFAWLGMVMHRITERLKEAGEPVPDLCEVAQSHPIKAVEFLFPHYFLLPYFTSFSAYRIRPLGPEKCFFEIYSLTMFPEGQEPEPVMEPKMLPFDSPEFPPIPRQDYSNIPIQQVGLHAEGFEFMRLSKDVEGMISNYQRIIDGYLAGTAPDKLAKATHLLCGNFDGPIFDLDLVGERREPPETPKV